MSHPNDMTAWPEIACQRGHDTHPTRTVHITLGGPTPYTDYAPIPERFALEFDLDIFELEPYDFPMAGAYCPAADAVSETIGNLGVWEVPETIVLIDLLLRHPDATFVDVGCHIGWFSTIAASLGHFVAAVDADPVTLSVAAENLHRASTHEGPMVWSTFRGRVGVDGSVDTDVRDEVVGIGNKAIVKIDIEGAEPAAVEMLRPLIEGGYVSHILMEISPVFHDGYPALVEELRNLGYVMMLLPEKSQPPATLTGIQDLATWAGDLADPVAEWHQRNVLFVDRVGEHRLRPANEAEKAEPAAAAPEAPKPAKRAAKKAAATKSTSTPSGGGAS